jgi:hypothetical protein
LRAPTNPDPLAKNGPTSQHARLAVVGSFELPQFAQLTSGSAYLSAR